MLKKIRIGWKVGRGVVHRTDSIQQTQRGRGFLKGAVMSCETDVLPRTTQNLCSRILLVAVYEFVRKAPSLRRDALAGTAIQGAAGQTPP